MIVIFRSGFFFSFFFDDFKFSTFANGKMASKGVENGLVFVLSLPHVTKCLENKKKKYPVLCVREQLVVHKPQVNMGNGSVRYVNRCFVGWLGYVYLLAQMQYMFEYSTC